MEKKRSPFPHFVFVIACVYLKHIRSIVVVMPTDLPKIRLKQQRRRDLFVLLQIVRLQVLDQSRIREQSPVQKEHVPRRIPIEQEHLQLLPHHAMVSLLRFAHRLLVKLLRACRSERIPIESIMKPAVRRVFARFAGFGGFRSDVIGACDAQTGDALRGMEMRTTAEIDEVSALVDLKEIRQIKKGSELGWEKKNAI